MKDRLKAATSRINHVRCPERDYLFDFDCRHSKHCGIVRNLSKGDWIALVRLVGFPAVGSLLLGVLSWAIPKASKESMVFWRLGVRRLPSSEAFTKIAHTDVRINFNELSSRLGALPEDYQKQSALWYACYRKHMKETAVTDANAAYLLYREITAITPVVLLIVLISGMTTHTDWLRIVVCCFGACVEYLLVMMAARNAGTRLVANVLAIEGASLKQTAAETPKASVGRVPRKRVESKATEGPKVRSAGGTSPDV